MCPERPTYTVSLSDNYPTHCTVHAPSNARPVSDAMCTKCHNESIINTTSHLCVVCEFGSQHGSYHHVKEERMD